MKITLGLDDAWPKAAREMLAKAFSDMKEGWREGAKQRRMISEAMGRWAVPLRLRVNPSHV